MIEAKDTMYADDIRNPHYKPHKHGFIAECAVCGELVHENESNTYIEEDWYDIYNLIGYVHDSCLDKLEDSL